ncbi:hypothetical protein Tsubulata_040201 [Turnera subulata]|uniref:Uncharacterized protein n=1 Tax=Turnera subulata TaxID=218843 RepID=A0A9Q0F931_9ROSI|nr:hypothetical protein Tsubulata_040201 [Turnera subulata]
MPSSSKSVSSSHSDQDDGELRRGPWTLEEDSLLVHYIAQHGEGRWNLLAKRAGLRRTGKSCRLRWLNYLKPDVKRGNLTPQEQLLILDLHSKWGNRWSKIAQHLPGRTDNEIKNYWRTRVQKQARHLKIDANSTKFQDMIRGFWIPRLLQKIEGSSSSPPDISSVTPTISQPIINYNPDYQHSTLQPPLPPPAPQSDQVSCQAPLVDMSSTVAMQYSLEHYEQLSDSEHCTSNSCISSTESIMSISHGSHQFSEYPPSPFYAIGDNTNASATFMKDCYYIDSSCCYGLETNLQAHVSALSGIENQQIGDQRHIAETNLVGYDLGEIMWNTDQLWQFRNSQEIRQN